MKVKLIKGLSYSNGRVYASKDKPIIEVNEAEGEKLLASGRFELVEDEDPPIPVAEESDDEVESLDDIVEEDDGEGSPKGENVEDQEDKEYLIPPVDFDKMTVNELKTYVKENEIDIGGLTRKDEIKQALLEAINNRVPDIFLE